MNFKLALAAAAVVGLAGTAQAADLAKKAPAAANYVKVCDAYGAGFFYIPGSDTCLKIGGFVRAEYRIYGGDKNNVAGNAGWASAPNATGVSGRNLNGITTRVRSDVNFDARTNTEMGLLRSYIDIWMTVDSTSNGTTTGAAATPITSLRKAFVQFAGITAGRATSFFDFYTGGTNSVYHMATADADVNLLAYTFSFGNGITASLSLEDATTSDESGLTAVGVRRLYSGSTVNAAGVATANAANGAYAGVKMTDVVANVNIAQAWGSAQVMGVLHDNYDANFGKLGYAIGAGAKINLPMLAAGDVLALQAIYGKGALGYVFGSSRSANYAWDDFNVNAAGTGLDQSSAWSVAAGLTHNWSKTLASTIAGSYASYDAPASSQTTDFKQIDVQANLVWKPVAGLGISANVEYRNVDRAAPLADGNAYVGFLRVQRDF